jgi:hypothetical protein
MLAEHLVSNNLFSLCHPDQPSGEDSRKYKDKVMLKAAARKHYQENPQEK